MRYRRGQRRIVRRDTPVFWDETQAPVQPRRVARNLQALLPASMWGNVRRGVAFRLADPPAVAGLRMKRRRMQGAFLYQMLQGRMVRRAPLPAELFPIPRRHRIARSPFQYRMLEGRTIRRVPPLPGPPIVIFGGRRTAYYRLGKSPPLPNDAMEGVMAKRLVFNTGLQTAEPCPTPRLRANED